MATKRTSGAGGGRSVEAFLNELVHGRKDEIAAIREAILSVDGAITERIKWNAPSFCINGDDRVTFRLHPGERVQLIFHRGSKKRDDADAFAFEDPSGLLEWVAHDRAVVTFSDGDDVRAKREALKDLVTRWMAATQCVL